MALIDVMEKWGPEFWIQTAVLTLVWDAVILDENEPFDAWEIGKVYLLSVGITFLLRDQRLL